MASALRFVVAPEQAGQSLEAFLGSSGRFGRNQARSLVDAGGVFVNRKRTKEGGHALAAGDRIEVHVGQAPVYDRATTEIPLLFQDEHLVIVNKPAGMPVEPTRQTDRNTVVAAVDRQLQDLVLQQGLAPGHGAIRPRAVHRLDREVTGALALALGKQAAAQLSGQFRHHVAHRTYLAVVAGSPEHDEARLVHLLKKNPRGGVTVREAPEDSADVLAAAAEGFEGESEDAAQGEKIAITRYLVLNRTPDCALLQVELETGRTHQIRAQLAAVGLPLVGDRRYGKAEGGALEEAAERLGRPALHGWILTLQHPKTETLLTVTAPLPTDLRALLDEAGLPLPSAP